MAVAVDEAVVADVEAVAAVVDGAGVPSTDVDGNTPVTPATDGGSGWTDDVPAAAVVAGDAPTTVATGDGPGSDVVDTTDDVVVPIGTLTSNSVDDVPSPARPVTGSTAVCATVPNGGGGRPGSNTSLTWLSKATLDCDSEIVFGAVSGQLGLPDKVEVEQSLTPHPTQYRSFRRRSSQPIT